MKKMRQLVFDVIPVAQMREQASRLASFFVMKHVAKQSKSIFGGLQECGKTMNDVTTRIEAEKRGDRIPEQR